jgi:hypothetical protein
MGKRMERTKRMGTDFDSPSARPYPPQAEKKSVLIRSIRLIRFLSCRFGRIRKIWNGFFHHENHF